MESLWQDLRFALRVLRKSPGFTAVAVLTLALGIGANTAMFSVIDAVLLRPLPYKGSDRMVVLYGSAIDTGNFEQWRQRLTSSYDRFAAFAIGATNITAPNEQLTSLRVSEDFFPMLGIRPAIGRSFISADFESKNPGVAVITDRLWRTDFSSDPKIIGRTVITDKAAVTIIGVLQPKFGPLPYWDIDIFLPLLPGRATHTMVVLGRLRPGVSPSAARAEATEIADGLATNVARRNRPLIEVEPFKEIVAGDARSMLLLAAGAMGLVLLIVCANIANLQLVRFAGRKREIAVRNALGASRSRITIQMMIEALMLTLVGGALGLLVAVWTMSALVSQVPFHISRIGESRIDGTALLFTLCVSASSTLLFGLIPALSSCKSDPASALKQETGIATAGAGQRRMRKGFLFAEIALATMTIVGAALVVKTYLVLRPSNPGFDASNKLTCGLTFLESSQDQRIVLLRNTIQRIAAIPGVRSVAAVSDLPMSGMSLIPNISIDGHLVAGLGNGLMVHYRLSTNNFLRVMHMPVVDGRGFESYDNEGMPKVAIINQTMARRFWPDGKVLGKRVAVDWGGKPTEYTIVGVVHDARIFGIDPSFKPEMYAPFWQDPFGRMTLVIEAAHNPAGIVPAVREALRPFQSIVAGEFETMEALLRSSVARPRFDALLFGCLAGLALLLAMLGTYGVISYGVTQRTREIGLRIVLGAQGRSLLGMVIREGMLLAGGGILLGIGGALVLRKFLSALLFGISPTDPVTIITAAALLGAVALLACYIPARRAMKVDPMVALRQE